jgi:23S rRNA (uracil1939-C5)-methyltransferase
VGLRLPGEEILTIEKLVYGGDGLARPDGKVILTPFVLPGERVRAAVEREKNDLFRGRLIEVMEASGQRVVPGCPYFQRCGGCQYQHLDYAAQVENKRSILREVLRRVGKIDFDGEVGAISGEAWQYRNRVQLHIDSGAVGYFEQGTHRLCAITHCPISSPKLNEAISALNANLSSVPAFTASVDLFTNETDVQINVPERVPRSVYKVLESLGTSGAIEYGGLRVSRNSFFQVNRFLIDRLVDCTLADSQGETALDLYAGAGLFTIELARRFKRVIAVESGRSAFRDLEFNVQDRAHAVEATTEEYLARIEERPDFILADPPRAGLGKRVIQELVRIRSPRLAIVACDPATLARDLQGLLGAGYRIGKLTMVDLFPQTFHIETVVQLEIRD